MTYRLRISKLSIAETVITKKRLNRYEVDNILSSVYGSGYKIYTVNSRDGVKPSSPIGLFLSLGLTTSLSTMSKLILDLDKIFTGNKSISEVISYSPNMGKYINYVTKKNVDYQFDSDYSLNHKLLNEKSAEKLLNELKSNIRNSKRIDTDCNRIYKLSSLIAKLKVKYGWENYAIQIDGNTDDFRIKMISKKCNFKDEVLVINDSEFRVNRRIGVLIEYN